MTAHFFGVDSLASRSLAHSPRGKKRKGSVCRVRPPARHRTLFVCVFPVTRRQAACPPAPTQRCVCVRAPACLRACAKRQLADTGRPPHSLSLSRRPATHPLQPRHTRPQLPGVPGLSPAIATHSSAVCGPRARGCFVLFFRAVTKNVDPHLPRQMPAGAALFLFLHTPRDAALLLLAAPCAAPPRPP